jgi:hypothetical protein
MIDQDSGRQLIRYLSTNEAHSAIIDPTKAEQDVWVLVADVATAPDE